MSLRNTLSTHFTEVSIGIFSFIATITLPIVGLLFFAGFLIFCDTTLGIWAAYKRGERIHSSKLRRVLSKVLIYPMIIIISAWAQKLMPRIAFIDGATCLIIVVEITSILENINDILGFNFIYVLKAYINNDVDALIDYKNKKNKPKPKKQN